MANVYCKKCLTSGYGKKEKQLIGQPCQTPSCDGMLEHEPEWDELIDILPEPMTCGCRKESLFNSGELGADRWHKFKVPHGNRVCSYCGSLHPEDFFELIASSASAPIDAKYNSVVEVEPTDKPYKIYVHQPGVRNAHEGGIKFYIQHLPGYGEQTLLVTQEQEKQYELAVKNTALRFEYYLKHKYDSMLKET